MRIRDWLLTLLLEVTGLFDMQTRPELILLQKTMVVIEGVARELEPQVNIWSLARPLVTSWVAENLGPKARIERAAADLKRGAAAWLALPGEITRLISERQAPPPVEAAPSMLPRLAGLVLAAAGAGLLAYAWGRAPGWQELAGVAALIAGFPLALRLRR